MENQTVSNDTISDAHDTLPDESPAENNEGPADISDAGKKPEDEWKNKYESLQDQFTRLAADFENYRKRTRDEKDALIKYGSEQSILSLLPVLDNLDRAVSSLTEKSEPAALFSGFTVIQKQLATFLDSLSVKRIESIGQPFDPVFHEAISKMPNPDHPEGVIAHEAQVGYMLLDKVIRPSMVVVSTGSPENDSDENNKAKLENPFQQKNS